MLKREFIISERLYNNNLYTIEKYGNNNNEENHHH